MTKLNLGCGSWILPGYVNCDLYDPAADQKWDAHTIPLEDNTVDEIYTSHLFEHFDYYEAWRVLEEWKRVLKLGGVLVIETPDFYASCKTFVELHDAGKWNDCIHMYSHFFSEPWVNPGQIHKFLYTPNQLRWTLEQSGFRNIRQEPALRYLGREHICMRFVCEK